MNNDQWLQNIARFRLLSWLIALGLLVAGFQLASLVNEVVYPSAQINPEITLWFTFFIVILGYSWWSAHIASVVLPKILGALLKFLLKAIFFKVRRKKSLNNEVLSEATQDKIIADMRRGTRTFATAGFLMGILLGVMHLIFIDPPPNWAGFFILVAYGYGWGYLWYRMSWLGLVPLPPEQVEID